MTYECGECYKSEKNCKCDKESECPTCDKSYNDNELLELDKLVVETFSKVPFIFFNVPLCSIKIFTLYVSDGISVSTTIEVLVV